MKIIGKAGKGEYIAHITEEEINRISGIDNVVAIEGRIKVGDIIEVNDLWDKLKKLIAVQAGFSVISQTLRTKANEIDSVITQNVTEEI